MRWRKMSCISRASGIADLPAPMAVCCHDAGGANLIAAWLAAEPVAELRLCAQGPAGEIFARLLPQQATQALEVALDGAKCLLSGSGWAADLEHDARVAARRHGVTSLAVLDHWVNYRARFVRNDVEILPDAFVVTDAAAAMLARETFGAARPILTWQNRYLQDEAARVRALSPQPPATPPARLLVVLEPVREDWAHGAPQAPELRALDYLMQNLAALTPRPQELEVRLRPHPSEPELKYQAWAQRQSHAHVRLSTPAPLASDLAWADAVAGLQSYALVVALAARRRAISYLPPGAPPCALRYPGVERLAALPRVSP
jgi:hypothetical protein